MSRRRGFVVVAHRTYGSPAVFLAAYSHLYRSRQAAENGMARQIAEGQSAHVSHYEVCEVRSDGRRSHCPLPRPRRVRRRPVQRMSRRVIAHRAVRGYGVMGFRAFGWQFDYRPDGWLPFSIRYGYHRWHILRLGRLGMLTAGPVIRYNFGVPVSIENDPSQVSR